MAATFEVSVIAELLGLGKDQAFTDKGADGTTPTAGAYMYRKLTTADVDEALDLGDVSTVTAIIISAVTNDLDIDLDYASSFDVDLTIKAGEVAAVIPNPAGVTQVKNNGSAETPTYEYMIVGQT